MLDQLIFVTDCLAWPSSTLFARVPNCNEHKLSFWESRPSRTHRNIIILALQYERVLALENINHAFSFGPTSLRDCH